MKHIYPLLLMINSFVYAQEKPISYYNYTSSYSDQTKNNWGWSTEDEKINEIILNPKGTFEFWSRPGISCSSWHQYKGNWEEQNDTITFHNQFEIEENDVRFTFSNNPENRFYLLEFKTDNNSILTNKEIKVSYNYNFDDEINDVGKTLYINPDNTLKIPYKDIPHRRKLASIRIEYLLNTTEKRVAYLTENNTVNVKYSDLPNIIKIEFVETPKKEMINRIVKGILKEDFIQIIYSGQTIPTLPDYSVKLNFESIYSSKNQ